MKPDISNLIAATEELKRYGITYALGGSGLLHCLGLTNSVRDWDIMTEAPKEQVLKALQNLYVQEITSGDYPFGSKYKLLIHKEVPQVEVSGNFSIFTDKGLCKLPTIPVLLWDGIQVGSPEVWYVAYSLLNRKDKSDLLLSFLKEKGADKHILQILKNEPLPDEILEEISSLE
jgi:hypothetical protein